jgi:hypothetical protein
MVPDSLVTFILWEVGISLILVIILLILIILGLLKKLVVSVTVVSVKTEAASYDHGDTVNISGDVTTDGTAQANVPVILVIKDSAGAEFSLPETTTDAEGKFAAAWTIPSEIAPGEVNVTATALGMTATTTFTFRWHEHHPRPSRGNKTMEKWRHRVFNRKRALNFIVTRFLRSVVFDTWRNNKPQRDRLRIGLVATDSVLSRTNVKAWTFTRPQMLVSVAGG